MKIDKILDEKELKILNKKMFIEEKIYKAKVNPLRQSNKKSWGQGRFISRTKFTNKKDVLAFENSSIKN